MVDTLVRMVLDQRRGRPAPRTATADAIRDQLGQSGLGHQGHPQGPRWSLGPR
ncbi:hypothetical protein [Streptomyces purpurascens]